LCASLMLHAGGGASLWRLFTAPSAAADDLALADPAPPPLSPAAEPAPAPFAVSVLEPDLAGGAAELPPAAPPPARPGDDDRAAAHPAAPTAAPNPDRFALAAAASSGDGPGRPRLEVTGRRDEEELRAQLMDADASYQMQRIRTGADRRSREDVRATPHPG